MNLKRLVGEIAENYLMALRASLSDYRNLGKHTYN